MSLPLFWASEGMAGTASAPDFAGIDPEGLFALASRMDDAAEGFGQAQGRLVATLQSLPAHQLSCPAAAALSRSLPVVSRWLTEQAADLRRRAQLVLGRDLAAAADLRGFLGGDPPREFFQTAISLVLALSGSGSSQQFPSTIPPELDKALTDRRARVDRILEQLRAKLGEQLKEAYILGQFGHREPPNSDDRPLDELSKEERKQRAIDAYVGGPDDDPLVEVLQGGSDEYLEAQENAEGLSRLIKEVETWKDPTRHEGVAYLLNLPDDVKASLPVDIEAELRNPDSDLFLDMDNVTLNESIAALEQQLAQGTVLEHLPPKPETASAANLAGGAGMLALGLIPGGDAVDLIGQGANKLKGDDVDEFSVAISSLGLAADLGWLNPFPGPEDTPNVGVAFLKGIYKGADGPTRKVLTEAVSDPSSAKQALEALGKLVKGSGEARALFKAHPEALAHALKVGPEAVEFLGKSSDDLAVRVAERHGEEAVRAMLHAKNVPGLDAVMRKSVQDPVKAATTVKGARFHLLELQKLNPDDIRAVEFPIDNLPNPHKADVVLNDGTVIDYKSIDASRYNEFTAGQEAADDVQQARRYRAFQEKHGFDRPIRYIFEEEPPAVMRRELERLKVVVEVAN